MKNNIYNNIYRWYWAMPDDNVFGIFGKVINRLVGKIVYRRLNEVMPTFFLSHPIQFGLNSSEKRNNKIICSLTSFPGRIDSVWVCIETIMRQTVLPDKIILWLSKDQFKDKELPDSIIKMVDKGLTINWVDGDIRSHKKYYYALQQYKDDCVILLDDDMYYPDQLIENLVDLHKAYPNYICATRVHRMTFKNGKLNKYKKWLRNYNGMKRDYLFFTSGAGTLIPPNCFSKTLFDINALREVSFSADDVWLNLNAKKIGIKIATNSKYNNGESLVKGSQCETLASVNVCGTGNDTQITETMKFLDLKIEDLK